MPPGYLVGRVSVPPVALALPYPAHTVMSRRKRWILGGLGVAVAVLAIAAFQFETRYEMGQVSFPWQKERRRLIAARAMFETLEQMGTGGFVANYRFAKTEEAAAEIERHRKQTQETCGQIATAWRDYVVRCLEPKPADRERISAEMTALVGKATNARISGCSGQDDGDPGSEEDRAACLRFFASGSCEIFDYGRDELALGLVWLRAMRPAKPQPHIEACPFIFY